MLDGVINGRISAKTTVATDGKRLAGDIGRAVASGTVSEVKPKAMRPRPALLLRSCGDGGPKRVVAVTACPTGVAHTLWRREAIETEAKNAAGG